MAVTNLQGLFDLEASGKAVDTSYATDDSTNGTAAVGASGFMLSKFQWNILGTTRYTTLKGLPVPAGLTSPLRLVNAVYGGNRLGTANISTIYKVGTLVFTSTGNQFTHDAATFPVNKKQMGTSAAINGKLMMIITTATSTTAPIMTINYTNQAGASITGTRTWTAPATTTAVAGVYQLPLEEGDTGAQDLASINISVASSAGAATIYLMEEHILLAGGAGAGINATRSPAIDSFSVPNLTPGTATSGTVVAEIMPVTMGSISNNDTRWYMKLVYDS